MKSFKLVAAQGDIMIIAVGAVPAAAKAIKPEGEHYIVAHSETGHHHVIDRPRAEVYESADDEFVAWVKTMDEGAEIKHLRDFDTHETIKLEPNKIYEIRRQREYVPEGWRRAQD